jgi:hypothetical protein
MPPSVDILNFSQLMIFYQHPPPNADQRDGILSVKHFSRAAFSCSFNDSNRMLDLISLITNH